MAKQIKIEGKVETVELSKLNIDPAYQRCRKAHSGKIAKIFNPEAAGVLHVARRSDDSLWLIDGQQRYWAMTELGIAKWKAVVIYSTGSEYEATVFRLINGRETRKGLTAHELFKSCLASKDPVALAVNEVVESVGLKIKSTRGGSRGFPEIVFVGSLYRLMSQYGDEPMRRALSVMVEAWPENDLCMKDLIPVSLCMLYARMKDDIDDFRMVEQLKTVLPLWLMQASSVSTQSRHASCQRVICEIYNRRLRDQSRMLKIASTTDPVTKPKKEKETETVPAVQAV